MSEAAPAFRCSLASLRDDEPLAGSAPSDARWLMIEQPGAWLPKAADLLDLPDGVRAGVWADARVQLIRRHGGGRTPGGLTAYRADLERGILERAVVPALDALPDAGWDAVDGPLWLVCAHGRRDVCCAELGRPIATRLAARWPEGTWETSHLGGHRFAPTLLALPSGVVLGRVGEDDAVPAAEALLAGRLPDLAVVRGQAGRPPAAQAAELHVRGARSLSALDAVRSVEVDGDLVHVHLAEGADGADAPVTVRITASSTPRRQSCGDAKVKPATAYVVSEV